LSGSADKKRSDLAIVRALWPHARPVRGFLLVAAVLMVVEELLPFAGPHILRKVVDALEAGQPFETFQWLLLALLGAILIQALAGFARTIVIEIVGAKIIHSLRQSLFKHVQGQGMEFFQRHPTGALMTRLGNDVDSINRLLSEVVLELTGSILMLVAGTAFMLHTDWRLALVCLAFLPPMLLATHLFRIKVRDTNRRIRTELTGLNTALQEDIGGAWLVRIFGREKARREAFAKHNGAYRDAFYENINYYAIYFPTLNILTELATALLFFLGATLFWQGEASLGTLAAFSWIMGMFFRPLRELSDRITNLQQSLTAGERVFSLFEESTALPAGSQPAPANAVGRVEFRQVGFGYNADKKVVQGIDLVIEPGKTIALVGATGSGKSTLASLLCRFYDPQEGQILLDGVDLRELDPVARGKLLGIVLQEPFLFPGSLLDNIALGQDESTGFGRRQAEELVGQLGLAEWVATLPEGLDTLVGERGVRLSTGQRQILSFARALAHGPRVLILDEATSAIDAQSEELLQNVTAKVLKGRSSLVIAHRLATIREADEILVLHHGTVRERGRHEELLAHGGIYARLWELQSRRGD
jgi:ATP-binding cassette, subfamily B, multidrug efflux pump